MAKDKAEVNMTNGSTKGNKSLVIVIAIAIIVICALVGIIIFLLLNQNNSDVEMSDNSVVRPDNVVMPNNVEEVITRMEEEKEERVPVGYYEVSMNTNWIFPDGNSVSTNAYVENSTSNQNTVYFTINLKGSEEIIYQSPYLMVGSYLTDIQLDKVLEKGTYDAVITYHLVDDEFKDLSSVSMFMTISIEQ